MRVSILTAPRYASQSLSVLLPALPQHAADPGPRRAWVQSPTVQGIDALVGLDNVWCDTSAVTDCGAMEVIINRLGHERLFYGSDFPVTHIRGRCVGIGDTFVWFYAKDIPREVMYGNVRPTLVGIESLRAIKVAAMATRLTDSQIEDVFYNNAAALYDIPKVGQRAVAT